MAANYRKRDSLPARMLTVSEVAEVLHVHPNTVRAWSRSGLLKAYRVGYRQDRRFKLQDINEFLISKQM
ncbi:MAG: hypothetical protein A2144_06660 [Chloroflexi bacterium RBG_16_50_9]|nr:MAG: hypothetical protein A2144_06660 [Chloroflexi bacterium RBG_16_50_9]